MNNFKTVSNDLDNTLALKYEPVGVALRREGETLFLRISPLSKRIFNAIVKHR